MRHPGRIYCFADTPEMCRVLLEAGARVIQLRHKTAGDDEFRRLARAMLAEVRRFDDALLIVNDRVDIAIEVGADGIHVGQEDLDAREVLRRAPQAMILGVSARTPAEARAAAAAGRWLRASRASLRSDPTGFASSASNTTRPTRFR